MSLYKNLPPSATGSSLAQPAPAVGANGKKSTHFGGALRRGGGTPNLCRRVPNRIPNASVYTKAQVSSLRFHAAYASGKAALLPAQLKVKKRVTASEPLLPASTSILTAQLTASAIPGPGYLAVDSVGVLGSGGARGPAGPGLGSSEMLSFPAHLEDEYDPTHPNDIMHVQKMREEEALAMRRKDELQQHLAALQVQQAAAAAARAAEAEATGRRLMPGSARGMDLRPAWMKTLDSSSAAAADPAAAAAAVAAAAPPATAISRNAADGGGGDGDMDVEQHVGDAARATTLNARELVLAAPPHVNVHTSSLLPPLELAGALGLSGTEKAARMMARWGYRPGQGLGKHSDGIITPLLHVKTGARTGVIRGGALATRREDGVPATDSTGGRHLLSTVAAPTWTAGDASHVVMLQNFVAAGEVDDELASEVEQECSDRFGEVRSVYVYECAPGASVPPAAAVRIFVEFADSSVASKAQAELHGRVLGGRRVVASLYDPHRFARFDLAPSAEEAAHTAA